MLIFYHFQRCLARSYVLKRQIGSFNKNKGKFSSLLTIKTYSKRLIFCEIACAFLQNLALALTFNTNYGFSNYPPQYFTPI